jgi:hypothetical protein
VIGNAWMVLLAALLINLKIKTSTLVFYLLLQTLLAIHAVTKALMYYTRNLDVIQILISNSYHKIKLMKGEIIQQKVSIKEFLALNSSSPFRPAHSMSKLRIRNGATFAHSPSGV